MSDQSQNRDAKDKTSTRNAKPALASPYGLCNAAKDLSLDFAVYLSLHCPRCGQMSSLSATGETPACMIEGKDPCQFPMVLDPYQYLQ